MCLSKITYKEGKEIEQDSLLSLYEDADWRNYTKNPQRLMKAVENSFYVLTANEGDKLVGLIRIISDGFTILYIQDLIVLKSYKRKKIGTMLLTKVFVFCTRKLTPYSTRKLTPLSLVEQRS